MQQVGLGQVAAGRYAAGQPYIATNGRTLTNGDTPQNRRARINHHIILNDRMAWMAFLQLPRLIRRKALGTQGHSLIDPHTFADDCGFSYHHTRAVIDKETAANLRAGVDINAGGRMGNFCADARQQRQPCTVQVMGQP